MESGAGVQSGGGNSSDSSRGEDIGLLRKSRALHDHGFDAALGGARRDEEKSRAKERVVSVRTSTQEWDPAKQRAEFWRLYNCRLHAGESIRAFPLANWTELDVWRYIELENLELPSIYFAH